MDRNGESKELTIKPELLEEENRYIIGVTFDSIKEPTVLQGFKQSFKESGSLIMQTMKVFGRLITGRGNFATDLGGPVTVINLSAGAADAGMWDLMNLVAILSISLACSASLSCTSINFIVCLNSIIINVTHNNINKIPIVIIYNII